MKALALAAVLLSTGCATIVNGRYQQIPVDSSPRGALVTVECPDQAPRDAGKTPTIIELRREAEGCRIVLTKLGYRATSVRMTRQYSAAAAFDAVPGVVMGAIAGLFTYVPLDLAGVPDDDAESIGNSAAHAGLTAPLRADERTGGAFKLVPGRVDVALRPLR